MIEPEAHLKLFNIPLDVKHSHSPEEMENMQRGLTTLTLLLGDTHKECIDHVVLYAELNIRFFFLAHLVDKNLLAFALNKFIENMSTLFKIQKEPEC